MEVVRFLGFSIPLLLAVLTDIRSYRIPNVLPALLAIDGLLLAFPASVGEALGRALVFTAVSVAAGALWLRGLLGGGDFKLLAACAVWIPASQAPAFLMAFGLASFAQGATALAWARFGRRTSFAAAGRSRMPYAVSIAAAGLIWSCLRLTGRLP